MRKIGVIFGGRSGEHDISLMSASAVLHAMDKEKYVQYRPQDHKDRIVDPVGTAYFKANSVIARI